MNTPNNSQDQRQNRPMSFIRGRELLIESEIVIEGRHQTATRIRKEDTPEDLARLLQEAQNEIRKSLKKNEELQVRAIGQKNSNLLPSTEIARRQQLLDPTLLENLEEIYNAMHPTASLKDKIKDKILGILRK